VEDYSRPGKATDDNMAHAQCMLDNWGYKHALRMCNTNCFRMENVVTRARHIVTLYVYCLACNLYVFRQGEIKS